jgi:isoleucyl-tRNA synthetase
LESDLISVHLVNWPDAIGIPESDFILETMKKVQDICTVGHALRKKYGIPVRQILRTFFITDNLSMDYIAIVADELNVESVVIGDKVDFDTEINEELKSEGNFRELVRFVQDMRKIRGLKAHDKITIKIKTNDKGKDFINFWQQALLSEVSAKDIVFSEEINGANFKIDDLTFDINMN